MNDGVIEEILSEQNKHTKDIMPNCWTLQGAYNIYL
jgi:hypothetical protein